MLFGDVSVCIRGRRCAQESVGTGEIVGSNKEASSEVASALPRGSSVEAISARTQIAGLPNDFFEVRPLIIPA